MRKRAPTIEVESHDVWEYRSGRYCRTGDRLRIGAGPYWVTSTGDRHNLGDRRGGQIRRCRQPGRRGQGRWRALHPPQPGGDASGQQQEQGSAAHARTLIRLGAKSESQRPPGTIATVAGKMGQAGGRSLAR